MGNEFLGCLSPYETLKDSKIPFISAGKVLRESTPKHGIFCELCPVQGRTAEIRFLSLLGEHRTPGITRRIPLPPAEPQLGESCPLEQVHMFGREQNPSPQEFLQIAGGTEGHWD